MHLHYCCGQLDKISLTPAEETDCPVKAVSSKDCCDSKHVELKVKADQERSAKWSLPQLEAPAPQAPAYTYLLGHAQQVPVHPFATGPPSGLTPVPLFIRNCVFRI